MKDQPTTEKSHSDIINETADQMIDLMARQGLTHGDFRGLVYALRRGLDGLPIKPCGQEAPQSDRTFRQHLDDRTEGKPIDWEQILPDSELGRTCRDMAQTMKAVGSSDREVQDAVLRFWSIRVRQTGGPSPSE